MEKEEEKKKKKALLLLSYDVRIIIIHIEQTK